MTLRAAVRIGVCCFLAFAAPVAASAQTPPTEQDLLARMSRQPAELVNYLELTRLYASGQRYADGEDVLVRAIAVVRSLRQAAQTQAGAPAAGAAPAEQDLLARVAASPNAIGNYLDLAKHYADARRFTEADQTLTKALALLRNARMGRGPASGQAPLRVGGNIAEPRKMFDVKPVYPSEAMAAKISGIIIIEAVIDTAGGVRDAKVLRSVPMLDQAALDAVKQWRYSPTLLNGAPVEVVMTVTVNFTIGN
jgi:TonB family protein